MIQTHDRHGNEWVKLSELREGDKVRLDRSFDCHAAGLVKIEESASGELYFDCSEGRHYLSGQADDGDHLVGIYPEWNS